MPTLLSDPIAQSVERSFNLYLKAITPAGILKEKALPLAEACKGTGFSAKYLNLLARQGKLEAYKQGRIWLTTKKAIKKYLESRQRKRS